MTPNSYNVVAAFDDKNRARRAVEDLSHRGLPKSHIRLVRSGSARDRARIAELRAEMQSEVSEGVGGPGIGFMTPDQAKGAFPGALLGVLLGAAIGAVLGFLWASTGDSSIPVLGRVLMPAAAGAFGGGTIGLIIGGATKPRTEAARRPGAMLDEKRMAAEATTLVEVEATDEHEATIVHEVLEQSGAVRVDDVDRFGDPMAPQNEHPRPADPPGYWANGGRGKG